MLFCTYLKNASSGRLKVDSLFDYAVVSVDGNNVGTLDHRSFRDSLFLLLAKRAVTLDILVKNMVRIHFGRYMLQNNKRIKERVMLGGKE